MRSGCLRGPNVLGSSYLLIPCGPTQWGKSFSCMSTLVLGFEISIGQAVCGCLTVACYSATSDYLRRASVFFWKLQQPISLTSEENSHHLQPASLSFHPGDFLEIALSNGLFKRAGPAKKMFAQGITCSAQLPNGDLLVGTGEGAIAKIEADSLNVKGTCQVLGAVTSIVIAPDHQHFFAGTRMGNIYWVDVHSLTPDIRSTCHSDKINCIVYPQTLSELFATASMNEIRLWNSRTYRELLRIHVPQIECYSVAFMNDGGSIVSGWSDGKVRAFLPQSGKLSYAINDAHRDGVTAIAGTGDSKRIVSGGMTGSVRVWSVGEQTQTMLASLKEHRSRVWSVKLRKNDMHVSGASGETTCS